MTQKHLTDQRFTDLDLSPEQLRAIDEAGFEFLTPIQARVLPLLLQQQDVAGQAQTGTGKTAAFLIAMYAKLQRSEDKTADSGPRALILAPTRELAIQIHKDAEVLGKYLPYRLALAYGGTGYESQRRALSKGFDVLVGTPGRVIDYYKQEIFSLGSIEVMILDEADRMFDLGFIRDIRFVLRRMPGPEKRLNMLFSATLSLRVNELAYEHMNNPVTIKVESEFLTVDRVEEWVYLPANDEKIPLLIDLLKKIDPTRTLLFVNTRQTAESVAGWLRGNGFSASVLSGDVPQKKREQLLQQFKQGELALLVATDVAARGLHIPDVSHVINFDLPQDPEDYVHRVGRTARAGARGDAISFACETHAFSLADIEKYIGHKIPAVNFDAATLAVPQPPQQVARRRPRKSSAGGEDRSGSRKARKPRESARKSSGARVPAEGPVTESQDPEIRIEVAPEAAPAAEKDVGPAPRRRRRGKRGEIPAVG